VSVHTVPNCGHAPALIADDQIEAITKADSCHFEA
jgi:hypothetical protein